MYMARLITIDVFATMGKSTHGPVRIVYNADAKTFTVTGKGQDDFIETDNTKGAASGDKGMFFKVDVISDEA